MTHQIALLAAGLVLLFTAGCAQQHIPQGNLPAHEKKRPGEPCVITYEDWTAPGQKGMLRCIYAQGHGGHLKTIWSYRTYGTPSWRKVGMVGDQGDGIVLRPGDYEVSFSSHPDDDDLPEAALRIFDDKRATLIVRHKP